MVQVRVNTLKKFQPILFHQNRDNGGQNLLQTDRQTDRQTNSLTPYTEVCGFFLSVKFLLPYLLCSQGDYYYVYVLHLYGPLVFGGFLSFSYYFKQKPIQIFLRKEEQAFLWDVSNEFNGIIQKKVILPVIMKLATILK